MSIESIASREPKYLGCRIDQREYYFFSLKDGRGRFIKYVAYPLWCKASDVADVLDISEKPTDEIVEEVKSFIQGKLQIEVIPKKRGRSEKIIKTNLGVTDNVVDITRPGRSDSIIITTTPELRRSGGTDGKTKPIISSGRSRSTVKSTGVRSEKECTEGRKGRSVDETPSLSHGTPVESVLKPKRKRRTKAEMEAARAVVPAAPVVPVVPVVKVEVKSKSTKRKSSK